MTAVWATLAGMGVGGVIYGLVRLWCRRTERRVLAADAARRLAPDRPTVQVGPAGRVFYVNSPEEFERLFGPAEPDLFPKVWRP